MITKEVSTKHFVATFDKNYSLCDLFSTIEGYPELDSLIYDVLNEYRGQPHDICSDELIDIFNTLEKKLGEIEQHQTPNSNEVQ